jgi:hypothetical protein
MPRMGFEPTIPVFYQSRSHCDRLVFIRRWEIKIHFFREDAHRCYDAHWSEEQMEFKTAYVSFLTTPISFKVILPQDSKS